MRNVASAVLLLTLQSVDLLWRRLQAHCDLRWHHHDLRLPRRLRHLLLEYQGMPFLCTATTKTACANSVQLPPDRVQQRSGVWAC